MIKMWNLDSLSYNDPIQIDPFQPPQLDYMPVEPPYDDEFDKVSAN